MLRILLFSAIALPVLAASPLVQSSDPGTPYCFGVNCPCGNDDPNAGCVNSTGQGALLTAAGSTSVAADDLTFTADHMATNAVSLLVFSANARNVAFRDGRLCVGPGMSRFWKHLNSGQAGTVTYEHVISDFALRGLVLEAGQTWNTQVWYRDPAQGGTCNGKVNLTNAYNLTFTP